MIEFNWTIVIFIIIALVAADKIITAININTVKKNFPDVDPLSIEKNPLAKEFFKQQGLLIGSIIYGIFSILVAFAFLYFANLTIKAFGVSNSLSISFYVFIIWYFFVLGNNFYFLLKFSKVIP